MSIIYSIGARFGGGGIGNTAHHAVKGYQRNKKHKGHPPSTLRLFLRGGKRTLRWVYHLLKLRDVSLATAIFVADIANLFGQIREVYYLRFKQPSSMLNQTETP